MILTKVYTILIKKKKKLLYLCRSYQYIIIMDLLIEKLILPEQRSFIAREIDLGRDTAYIHSHSNYELNYIKRGWGQRFIGDHFSDFSEGDLVLLGPDIPHSWKIEGNNSKEPAQCIVIHFHEMFANSQLVDLPELAQLAGLLEKASKGIHFKIYNNEMVNSQLEQLSSTPGLAGFISLLQVFDELLKVNKIEILSTGEYTDKRQQKNMDRMTKIYDFVMHHFREEIILQQAADVINMTQEAFCRYFKKQTDRTFFDLLKDVRIGFACKQLLETSRSISEICYESGYNNLAHFNNQFKTIKRMSPRQFRKKLKMESGRKAR